MVHLPAGEELICFISSKNVSEIELLTIAKNAKILYQRKVILHNAFQKLSKSPSSLPDYELELIYSIDILRISQDFDYHQIIKAHRFDTNDALVVQT